MFRFITKLFAAKTKSTPQNVFKPSVDELESRQLMSVSSAAIHAVAARQPSAPSSVFYFDSKHLLTLNGQELPQNIKNTPVGIQTFSAGLDAIGSPDVFVKASDKSIWKWNEGDWTKVLGPANGVTSFAAVNGDRAYAIYNDGSLHEFNGDVWSKVPNSTPVKAIDAITDSRGNDCVFALNTNGTFGEYFGGHFDLMLSANARVGSFPVTLGSFSAATDQFGDGIVYGILIDRGPRFSIDLGLYRLNYFGAAPTFITTGVTAFSGTTGAVWIAETNGSLEKFDPAAGFVGEPGNVTGIVSLSAANGTDVYDVSSPSDVIDETVTSANGFTEVISYQDRGKVKQ